MSQIEFNEKALEKIKKDICDLFKINDDEILKLSVGKIGDFNIFLVDGNIVKLKYEMDFVEAGNPFRYPKFIPKNEIWIDINLEPDDWIPNCLHEYIESILMRDRNLSYDKAHDIANIKEKKFREELE